MATTLVSLVPDAELLLALEPEELGLHLLQVLKDSHDNQGQVILTNALSGLAAGYPTHQQDSLFPALSEAWAWLESEGLLVPAWRSSGSPPWRVLSRRARKITTQGDVAAVRLGALLPKAFLHAAIPREVVSNFMRGELDMAVFQAMRQVEIALREATGIEKDGVKLARAAFDPQDGPLTDATTEGGERQAMSDLFAGSLGVLKNPHSHRKVGIQAASEAAAAILLASYLISIIAERSPE